MTVNDIIDGVIAREGPPTNDARDAGGRTQFGIAEASNPEAWLDGKVTEEEAREIYARKYVVGPGFDRIHDPRLQALMVDFGVTSGPQLAIMKMQGVLGIAVDGILGDDTLRAAIMAGVPLINKVVAERLRLIGRIVSKDPSQAKFALGWINRALEFLI